MFERSVDRFRGAVAGAGPVEEREHVDRALFQCLAETADLDQGSRDVGCDRTDDGLHQLLASGLIRFSARGHDLLINASRRFDPDIALEREDSAQTPVLFLHQQVGTGMQGLPAR